MMTSTVTSEGGMMIMNEVICGDKGLIEEHQIKEEILSEDEITPSNFEMTTHTPLICTCTLLKTICKSEDEEMTGELQQLKEEDESASDPLHAATVTPTKILCKCICKCEDEGITNTNNTVEEQKIKEENENENNLPTHQNNSDIPLYSVLLKRLTEDEIMRWSSREGANKLPSDSQIHTATKANFTNHFRDIPQGLKECDYGRIQLDGPTTSQERAHTDEMSYNCYSCMFRTNNRRDLKRHINKIHTMKPCDSLSCEFTEKTIRVLRRFRKSQTGSVSDKEPYACDICKFRAGSPTELKCHLMIHNSEKRYACDSCDFRPRRLQNLDTHKMTKHNGEKLYSCDSCEYKTETRKDLEGHIRKTHNIEKHPGKSQGNVRFKPKRHACDMCDFKATTPCDLKRHQRTHSGEKPFACDKCEYRAARLVNLKIHVINHTGEKPFACDSCDYRASRSDSLKIHRRIHTGEKPYSCSNCNFKARFWGVLKRHMRSHTGEKPFTCKKCNYRTALSTNLKRHTKTHDEPINT